MSEFGNLKSDSFIKNMSYQASFNNIVEHAIHESQIMDDFYSDESNIFDCEALLINSIILGKLTHRANL